MTVSTTTRKRRSDRNHVIYAIENTVTQETYIGVTVVVFGGNVDRSISRRVQKHVQRAFAENKKWSLSESFRTHGPENHVYYSLEVVRGKKPAHARETTLINEVQPKLNTMGLTS